MIIAYLGNYILFTTLILSLLIGFLPFIFRKKQIIIVLQSLYTILITSSFLLLIYAFLNNDFTLQIVVNHSHTSLPTIYKIAACWSNHDGSMILLLLIISYITLYFFKKSYKLIQLIGIFNIFFLTYTIFTSNPFNTIYPVPIDGYGFNPTLQDIAVSIHPPILYIGYCGTLFPYAIGILFLITGKEESILRSSIKKISLICWGFLSLGIGLGSWWAYRELGWGGFWFWDPVENASLLPWLCLTALFHSMYLKNSIYYIILSGLTFFTFLIGSFIVRSGSIISVHSFAYDSEKAIFILLFFAFNLIIWLTLVLRYIYYHFKYIPIPAKRKIIIWHIILILFIITFIIIGTLYPFLYNLFTKSEIIIEASFYNTLVLPLFILLSFIGGSINIEKRSKIVSYIISCSLITFLICYIFKITNIYSIFGISSSIYFLQNTIINIIAYKKNMQKLGMHIGHISFCIIIFSISLNSGLIKSVTSEVKTGETVIFQNKTFKIGDLYHLKGENYLAYRLLIGIYNNDRKKIGTLSPEFRTYDIEKKLTSKTSIIRKTFYDISAVICGFDNKSLQITLKYQPMIGWIWFGTILLFMSSIISLFRRFK